MGYITNAGDCYFVWLYNGLISSEKGVALLLSQVNTTPDIPLTKGTQFLLIPALCSLCMSLMYRVREPKEEGGGDNQVVTT